MDKHKEKNKMLKTNYANAYKEVLIILDNLIKEDYDKIPKEYIEFLKSNCNNEYEFYYDNSKTFEEQELLDDTKYILFGLFEKFGATELQKEKIKNLKIPTIERQKKKKENNIIQMIFLKMQIKLKILIQKCLKITPIQH